MILTSGIASAKPHATRALLLSLPTDFLPQLATIAATLQDSANELEVESLQEEIKEALDVTAFFECLEKHSIYSEVWSRKPREE